MESIIPDPLIPDTVEIPAPCSFTISDCRVDKPMTIQLIGREVGGTLWERIKTAWGVVTGKHTRLYHAHVMVNGCIFDGEGTTTGPLLSITGDMPSVMANNHMKIGPPIRQVIQGDRDLLIQR